MELRESTSAEVLQLRHAVHDLVSLSTLPAVWTGYAPDRIAEELAEVLLASLSLDLVLIRLVGHGSESGSETARYRGEPDAGKQGRRIGELLRPWLNAASLLSSSSIPASSIPDPYGSGFLNGVVTRLGKAGELGILVVASARPDFPTEIERLLLSAATNQASVALQHKEIERTLREQQEWLHVTLASLGDGVVTTDLRGRVTFLNPVAQELTGWSPDEALGRPLESIFCIINEQTRKPAENPLLEALRRGRVVGLAKQTLLRSRDGTERPVDDSAAPILGANGEVVGAILVFRDITERYRAEQAARERERLLREESRTIETINRVGRSLTGELDLENLVQAVTDAGTELTGAAFGAFFYNVLNAQGESYTLYTLSGAPREAFERFPLPRNTEVFAPTFRGDGVVRSADVTQDPNYGKSAPYYGMPEGHLPVRSYLAVPVISRTGDVVGGLFFGHPEPGVFTERSERVVVGIAAQAAVAIDNARLYRQVTTELTERRRAETLLTAQKALLELIARGAELPNVLESLARMIESQADGCLCSILLLDDAGCLRHGAAPSLPLSYRQAIDGSSIGPAQGSCGTAAFRKERVVVTDIEHDPLWEKYRDLALAHDLRACWSTPITSPRGDVLGSVAMYFREPREPSAADEELTEIATHLAGIAIERARTEEALRQSEYLLRTIIDTEPECVKLVDRDGTLRLMNQAGLRMIEAERLEEVVGTCVYQLIAPEYRDAFVEMNQQVFRGETVTLQFELIGLRGTRRWMETHAVPLRDEREVITAQLAVTRDITAQKRDEEALREQTVELATRDREKDEFLAMLAHELRNPLAPVLNAIQVLQTRGALDAVEQRQREIIDRQARHMARLLDDLLDISRITQGKIELRTQPLELGTLVAQATETARLLTEQREHELLVRLPGEPLYMDADPARIHQIISNLLTNAAKYTPPGGRIIVTLRREGAEAMLSVTDTGQGLPPELLPRVFDLFVQVDRSLSRGASGLGIGLTMVQRLVWLHGGRVEARSAGVGRGSEFLVVLPLLPVEGEVVPSPSAPPVPETDGAGRRVLIIDDNQDAAESLADLTSLWGYDVCPAFDGLSGLQAAREHRPEIILLDISMPGMSGFEVVRALRQAPELEPAFIIALTGYGQEEDRRRTREAGFDHHLTKPVDPDALRLLLDGSNRR